MSMITIQISTWGFLWGWNELELVKYSLCARHYSNPSISVTENFPQFTDLGGFIQQFLNGATSHLADRKELYKAVQDKKCLQTKVKWNKEVILGICWLVKGLLPLYGGKESLRARADNLCWSVKHRLVGQGPFFLGRVSIELKIPVCWCGISISGAILHLV